MSFVYIPFSPNPQSLIYVTLSLFTTSLQSRKGRALVSLFQDNSLLMCNVLQFIKHFHIHDFIWVLTLTVPWGICKSVRRHFLPFTYGKTRVQKGGVFVCVLHLRNERAGFARPVSNFALQGPGKIR